MTIPDIGGHSRPHTQCLMQLYEIVMDEVPRRLALSRWLGDLDNIIVDENLSSLKRASNVDSPAKTGASAEFS